jgi:hypothetical protein
VFLLSCATSSSPSPAWNASTTLPELQLVWAGFAGVRQHEQSTLRPLVGRAPASPGGTGRADHLCYCVMVAPAGFEPATRRLETGCAIRCATRPYIRHHPGRGGGGVVLDAQALRPVADLAGRHGHGVLKKSGRRRSRGGAVPDAGARGRSTVLFPACARRPVHASLQATPAVRVPACV